MAIIVDSGTRLVVQGLTGIRRPFPRARNRAYGTKLVAGVTPGKGGQDVEGVPVFDTVARRVSRAGREHGDDLRARAVRGRRHLRGGRRRHRDGDLHHRRRARARHAAHPHVHPLARRDDDRAELPRRALAREGERRHHPGRDLPAGNIGLVSRSGTLTYQIGHELTQLGLGNSTIVGIGGDPVVGSSFIDILAQFEADPETEYVVMVGEIGGDEEEKAAAFIEAEMTKPVVAYIAGFTAPPARRWVTPGRSSPARPGPPRARRKRSRRRAFASGRRRRRPAELVAEIARA